MHSVKKLDGTTASSQEEHVRWRQHFSAVLNSPEPQVRHDFDEDDSIQLDIDTNGIAINEVHTAVTTFWL